MIAYLYTFIIVWLFLLAASTVYGVLRAIEQGPDDDTRAVNGSLRRCKSTAWSSFLRLFNFNLLPRKIFIFI